MVKSTDYCENFVVKIIEGAAHWPHQQMPDDFNRTILKFLVGMKIFDFFLNFYNFLMTLKVEEQVRHKKLKDLVQKDWLVG